MKAAPTPPSFRVRTFVYSPLGVTDDTSRLLSDTQTSKFWCLLVTTCDSPFATACSKGPEMNSFPHFGADFSGKMDGAREPILLWTLNGPDNSD
jgi:hypothetical protein